MVFTLFLMSSTMYNNHRALIYNQVVSYSIHTLSLNILFIFLENEFKRNNNTSSQLSER